MAATAAASTTRTATGEPISESVARTIASYWVTGPGPLAEMARGWHVSDRQALLDDLAALIVYARSAKVFDDKLTELYALREWIRARD